MTTQRLTCTVGNHQWTREAKRGRAPTVCPAHKGGSVTVDLDTTVDTTIDPEVLEADARLARLDDTNPVELSTTERIDRLILRIKSLQSRERSVIVHSGKRDCNCHGT